MYYLDLSRAIDLILMNFCVEILLWARIKSANRTFKASKMFGDWSYFRGVIVNKGAAANDAIART